jgi:Vitamin K epoxide reductase family
MTPHGWSTPWRQGAHGHMNKRRGVIGLAVAAAGTLGLATLYQTRLIRQVPEPPFPGSDAERINDTYVPPQAPDAAFGLASYAVTLCLAAAGGPHRAREQPWLPLALAAKVGVDAYVAARLTLAQETQLTARCVWRLLTSGATLLMVPLVLPEAQEALQHATGRACTKVASDVGANLAEPMPW